ncbi:aldehyde dehydrogenase family protein, partial [Shigella flexneri]
GNWRLKRRSRTLSEYRIGLRSGKTLYYRRGNCSAFTERFVSAAAALKMGDPRDEENALAPMARFDLRDELHHQVEKTLAQGARLLLGGKRWLEQVTTTANGSGQCYPRNDRVSGRNVARCCNHHCEKCRNTRWNWRNDSEFGLSATILPPTKTQARQMAARLECGGAFINGYCASDARVAFGGVKEWLSVVSFPISAYTNSVISRQCGKTGSDATYSAPICRSFRPAVQE